MELWKATRGSPAGASGLRRATGGWERMAVSALSRAETAEAELRLLPGVIAARCLWPEGSPVPQVVRLLAEEEGGGQRLVDAVRTLFSVRFARDLPEERILLLPVAATPERSRFRLDGLELRSERGEQRIRLRLTMPFLNQQVATERVARPVEAGLLRAAGETVVDLINEYMGHTFDLEAIGTAPLADATVTLAALRARIRRGQEREILMLYGVSSEAGDPAEAAARATLDAANRIFR